MTASAPEPGRLVESPVFVLSAVRSGSTLLRALLDAHSQMCSPHELHLKDIDVVLGGDFAERSMREFGLAAADLRYLLWDRLMHLLLARSGKRIFVNKTPTDAFVWREIRQSWPRARYLFLLRHPAAIAHSWDRAQIHWTFDEAVADVRRYVAAVEEARRHLPGLTVRYEELTAEPDVQLRRVCRFLGTDFEPGMLRYGDGPGPSDFQAGLGDWSAAIRSGRPRPARPLPDGDGVPASLRSACRTWGYL